MTYEEERAQYPTDEAFAWALHKERSTLLGGLDRYREALENLLSAIHTMPGIPNSELCKAMCSARETLKD